MSTISTHVLDTARGRPAEGIEVSLEKADGCDWSAVGSGTTNSDGRVTDLLTQGTSLEQGLYRMNFLTGPYLEQHAGTAFYPTVEVQFVIEVDGEHYHIPLLLSPFGYSTYRGS